MQKKFLNSLLTYKNEPSETINKDSTYKKNESSKKWTISKEPTYKNEPSETINKDSTYKKNESSKKMNDQQEFYVQEWIKQKK